MPWNPWYVRTRVHENGDEQWFSDEAEAIAADWPGAAVGKVKKWPANNADQNTPDWDVSVYSAYKFTRPLACRILERSNQVKACTDAD